MSKRRKLKLGTYPRGGSLWESGLSDLGRQSGEKAILSGVVQGEGGEKRGGGGEEAVPWEGKSCQTVSEKTTRLIFAGVCRQRRPEKTTVKKIAQMGKRCPRQPIERGKRERCRITLSKLDNPSDEMPAKKEERKLGLNITVLHTVQRRGRIQKNLLS